MREVIYDFTPDSPDQIALTVGDVIGKVKDVGNGWFLGNNNTTGQSGLFPAEYVKEKEKKANFAARFKSRKDGDNKAKKSVDFTIGDRKLDDVPAKGIEKHDNRAVKNVYEKNIGANAKTDNGKKAMKVGKGKSDFDDIALDVSKADKVDVPKVDRGKSTNKRKMPNNAVTRAMRKMFATPSSEYKIPKAILGVFFGLATGAILFVILVYSYDIRMPVSGGIAAVCAVLLCLAFALTTRGRCVGLLVLPTFSTGRGRAALYSLIAGLILSGPLMNITNNAEEISASLACNAELAYNRSLELRELAAAPLRAIVVQIEETVRRIKDLGQAIIGPLKKAEEIIRMATAFAQRAADAFRTAAEKCEGAFLSAYNGCVRGINGAKQGCLDAVGKIPVVGGGGGPIPGIPGIGRKKRHDVITEEDYDIVIEEFLKYRDPGDVTLRPDGPAIPFKDRVRNSRRKRALKDACNVLDISSLCNALKVTGNICQPIRAVSVSIESVITLIHTAIDAIKDQFAFDVKQRNIFTAGANASQSAGEIRDNIVNEIRETTRTFHDVLLWVSRILAIFLLLVVIQSILYVRKFLTKDKFDNFYVTRRMKREDDERKAEGQPTVLPLQKKEKKKYIDSTTLKLSPLEKNKFKIGIVSWMLNLVVAIVIVLFDVLLWWMMSVINKHSGVSFTVTSETDVALDVEGSGVFAGIVRAFVTGFTEQSQFNSTTDFAECLPRPLQPNYNTYGAIAACYLIALILILLQAYLLRLRRKITAYFYPEREMERLDYLTKQILRKRKDTKGKLSRSVKKSVREKKLEKDEGKRTGFLDRIIVACSCCRRRNAMRCLACNERGDIVTCDTRSCQGVYCRECYDSLGGCQLCTTN